MACVNLTSVLNTGKDPVFGQVYFKQTPDGVQISGKILGLEPGKHGLMIHTNGDLGQDCKNTGGHFNPEGLNKTEHVCISVSFFQIFSKKCLNFDGKLYFV